MKFFKHFPVGLCEVSTVRSDPAHFRIHLLTNSGCAQTNPTVCTVCLGCRIDHMIDMMIKFTVSWSQGVETYGGWSQFTGRGQLRL